jgi:hypothetical protein
MQNHAVHVLFLRPGSKDPFVNRLTGYVGGMMHGIGACHVEICMPHADGFMTSSIYNGETVNITTSKSFSNPGYDVHTLMVTDRQLQDMKQTVVSRKNRQDPFDALGMYLAVLPIPMPRLHRRSNATFCSKYVTEVLQAGGVEAVKKLNPTITTPSRLLRCLTPATKGMMGSMPMKLRTFEQSAVFRYTGVPEAH